MFEPEKPAAVYGFAIGQIVNLAGLLQLRVSPAGKHTSEAAEGSLENRANSQGLSQWKGKTATLRSFQLHKWAVNPHQTTKMSRALHPQS